MVQKTSFFEIFRWSGVALGFFLCFLLGNSPAEQFNILTLFIVTFIAGLTALEGLLFSKEASESTGYIGGRGYQRQSALNNLALALVTIVTFSMGWGVFSSAALMSVLLVFLSLSSINHLYSAIKEDNKTMKSYLRPVLTVLLIIVVLPVMIPALL